MTELIAHTQHHGRPLGGEPFAATETGTQGHPAEREGVASPGEFPNAVPGPFALLTLGEGWTPAIRSACQDECAEYGDPACYELAGDTAHPNTVNPLVPCEGCIRAGRAAERAGGEA